MPNPTAETAPATFDKAFDEIASATPAETPETPEEAAATEETPAVEVQSDAPAEETEPAAEPEAPAKEPAEEAPAEEAAAPEGEGDEEKPPEGLTEKAQSRFKEILEDRKVVRAENVQLKQNFAELTAWVRETGATPEEFQQQVDRLRVFKSGKPEELKVLRGDLLRAVEDITVRLGDEAPGFDPLEGFDDLKKEVDDLKLTPERAKEIAIGRRQKARGDRTSKEQQQADQHREQQEAHRTQVSEATVAIRKLEANWKKTDPDAERKIKAILENMEDFKYIPPRLWPQTVEKRYKAMSGLAPVRSTGGQRPAGGTKPRPGAKAEPTSLGSLMDTMVET